MTLTRIVGRARTIDVDGAELAAMRASSLRTVVDVGTGDGRYAYALATAHPDWFVIGVDALDEPMAEIAQRATRKPAKGGRPNVVFVRAAIEAVPEELRGIADEVHVLLPWGRLLEGIVTGEDAVVGGLAALTHAGARIAITLNGEVWEESTPVRYADLPAPTPEYVAEVVAPAFGRHGIDLGPGRHLSATEAKAVPTTWARRLGQTRASPRFVGIEGRRR
jgi:16S rRNA (adenine(1408)-N(1))-methyltransferase